MKITKSTIVKAFSASKNPGIVSIKRFSKDQLRVRRYSQDGEVEFDETITDDEVADAGTDEIVDEVPAENVSVFSDEDTATDEIIAEVDGGDATPVIEAKTSDGFVEDTVEETDAPAPEDEQVAEECGDDSTAAALKSASQKC